ncbi:MAG: hypothetical protein ACTH2K_07145 [Candidatus Corynebacterium faecigallinarum]
MTAVQGKWDNGEAITFTSLLRDPKSAAKRAEEGPVRVKRRDGADLVLVAADQYQRPDEGVEEASRLLGAMESTGSFDAAVDLVFPWVEYLSGEERGECVGELQRKLRASASVGKYAAFHWAVVSWRGTAEVYADGIELDDREGSFSPAQMPTVGRPEEG